MIIHLPLFFPDKTPQKSPVLSECQCASPCTRGASRTLFSQLWPQADSSSQKAGAGRGSPKLVRQDHSGRDDAGGQIMAWKRAVSASPVEALVQDTHRKHEIKLHLA